MRLDTFIVESINDKALLKAVFFIGYPGSGKTTVSRMVRDGALPIMSISSDVWTEFFANNKDKTDWAEIGGKVKTNTMKSIVSNTDGLLPLFVDTTGANVQNFKNRVAVLKDLGYDVSLVIVDVKPETSAKRVLNRNKTIKRQVNTDFLAKAHKDISQAIPKFKSVIPDNMTVQNDHPTREDIMKAYRQVVKFFNKPIQNEKGKKLVDFMKKNGYKYYRDVPEDWKTENGFPDLNNNSMKWFKKI